jgi:hypothetical protein
MRGRVIEKNTMSLLVMFSQTLAVISHGNYDGTVIPGAVFQE